MRFWLSCHFPLKKSVQIIYNNTVILTGTRSVASNDLWIVNVNRPSFDDISSCSIFAPVHTDQGCSDVFATEKYFCNVLTPHNNSTQERVICLQSTMVYPTKTALRIAVGKGNVSSFPGGLTSAQINRYYYILEPSVKGHLAQERQGIQST